MQKWVLVVFMLLLFALEGQAQDNLLQYGDERQVEVDSLVNR